MRIGIVGAGKVGVSVGKYFRDADASCLVGYYSRTYKSAEEGAAFTDTKAFSSLQELIMASDTLLITTPDAEIGKVWDCIAEELKQNYATDNAVANQSKIVCHLSGSLSSEVFSKNNKLDFVHGCSMHPMYAFHDKFSTYQQLHQAFFTLEGDAVAVEQMTNLLAKTGNSYAVISPQMKVKYHCAASLASNHVIGLLETSIAMLKECGFSEVGAYEILAPLVKNNVENVFRHREDVTLCGTANALTGPIERNDMDTVKKHLEVLTAEEQQLYELLGMVLVKLSEQKHPDGDFVGMKDLLQNRKRL